MNKQQLAAKIWASANKMRSKIDANDYKDYILGFIFYKYLSERELELFRKEKLSEDEIKKVDEKDVKYAKHVRETLGYFISYDNLFSTWIDKKDHETILIRDVRGSAMPCVCPKRGEMGSPRHIADSSHRPIAGKSFRG